MYNFKVGDLVANNIGGMILKVGVIIEQSVDSFSVRWTSYDKDFFMEKEGDIFIELNNLYLLSFQSIDRNNAEASLRLLSAS